MSDDLSTVDLSGGLLAGHDGSAFADHAVEWTLGMARRLATPVTIVHAWVLTTAPRPATWTSGYVPPLADYADAVASALAADTAAIRDMYADVDVSCRAVHGAAANCLIAASEQAELLVLGPRGLGGFRGLVLGSVTEKCVRHAACAVVVVRPQDRGVDDDSSLVLDAGVSDEA